MVIPWFHKNLNTNNTPLLRCLLSFRTFHKPYQSARAHSLYWVFESREPKFTFWKLKIRHHNYSQIKYICQNTIYKFWRNFIRNLYELQQLEDESKNNVQKWHWVSHVQKTIKFWIQLNVICPCRNKNLSVSYPFNTDQKFEFSPDLKCWSTFRVILPILAPFILKI